MTRLQKSGYYTVPYQVRLQKKVAFPFVAFIMTMRWRSRSRQTTGRSGALYGIGIGIVMAILHLTGQSGVRRDGWRGPVVAGAGGGRPTSLFAAVPPT